MIRNIGVAFKRTARVLVVLSLMICNKLAQIFLPADEHCSIFKKVHENSVSEMTEPISFHEWKDGFGSWESIKLLLSSHIYSLTFMYRWVDIADDIPNVKLARLLTSSTGSKWVECRLNDYIKGTRPLVLCFGSCTCSSFISKLKDFTRLAVRYEKIVDFLMIYTWDVSSPHLWHSQKSTNATMAERLKTAGVLLDLQLPFPLLLDLPDDAASGVFQANPDRLCIVCDDMISYMSRKTRTGFDTSEAEEWIREYIRQY